MDISGLYQHYLLHPDISTDSRNISPGCIFFGIKGPSYDGNTFARQALEQGASLAVVDNPIYYGVEQCLVVDNSLRMLQELATLHRSKLNIPVIGITGSNGKTTTKELIKTVLETRFRTIYTQGNLNNHIGVPLSLLKIKADTQIAVIEMGANHRGEIAELCEMAQPTHGILTNIGKAHLGGFGGIEGIILTKRALYDAVGSKNGSVIVNADNPLLMELSEGIDRWTYGLQENAKTHCFDVTANPFLSFSYAYQDINYRINSSLLGDYNYENMMAAVCVGLSFSIEPVVINEALEAYKPSNNRSQLFQTEKNTIFLDAYNANPSSMQVAIKNFHRVEAGNKALILGDMLELGEESDAEHLNIVHLIQALGFTNVSLVGPSFQTVNDQAHFRVFPDALAAKVYYHDNPHEQYTILLKGSRGIALEQILDTL